MSNIVEWIDKWIGLRRIWYIKRLSHNDTHKSGGHQAGPYIPKELLFRLFPDINCKAMKNPRVEFDLYVDSHADHRRVRAIWYNNKFWGGTRNETRLTGFGGSESAFLDSDNAGSIVLFVFCLDQDGQVTNCHTWICEHGTDEELVEDYFGTLLPKRAIIWPHKHPLISSLIPDPTPLMQKCRLGCNQMPKGWLDNYPSAREVMEKTVNLTSILENVSPDIRVLKRVECEYELFKSIEKIHELPKIRNGFSDVEEFLDCAKTITQRRRARAGLSLELHTRKILEEEGLIEGQDFDYQAKSEGRKRPDFLFPSGAAYSNAAYDEESLAMLAVKRSTRDRWRQILNEADRIRCKHLFTIQESVSESQIREMIEANVRLVVPKPLLDGYPSSVRNELLTLEDFVAHVRLLRRTK